MSARTEETFQLQLGLLIEAGGRVQTAVGKVFHWGLGATDVVTGESNRDCLLRDLDDLKAAAKRIEAALSPSCVPLSAPKGGQAPGVTVAEAVPSNGR